ncbi:MAG TPA: phosphate ABC transporter permease PstA [Chloroflexota bacterium]|nr:phosphate ABC transporter permease PstA [Chloroflexota bacterium]
MAVGAGAAGAAVARRRLSAAAPGERRRRIVNAAATGLIAAAAALSSLVLVLILGYVAWQGLPALNLPFFTERPRPYGEVGGGVAPAILGTLIMLLVAALLSVPLGIGTAIYLAEFGRGAFARLVRLVVDLLAGLPSIVVGVFVWALLVRHVVGQYSGLAGAVALAIIMVPIMTRSVEEILRLVPDALRESALALGVPRWRTILGVVLPTARVGVITGVALSLARAGGETAPLLLTALGNQFFSFNLLGPMAALPVQIYTYAVSPYDDWHTKAWGSALILVLVVGCLSLAARAVTGRARW